MIKHKETLDACEAVDKGKWPKARGLFYEAAGECRDASMKGHHLVFVLDESSSMVSLKMDSCLFIYLLIFIFVCVQDGCLRAYRSESRCVGHGRQRVDAYDTLDT